MGHDCPLRPPAGRRQLGGVRHGPGHPRQAHRRHPVVVPQAEVPQEVVGAAVHAARHTEEGGSARSSRNFEERSAGDRDERSQERLPAGSGAQRGREGFIKTVLLFWVNFVKKILNQVVFTVCVLAQ